MDQVPPKHASISDPVLTVISNERKNSFKFLRSSCSQLSAIWLFSIQDFYVIQVSASVRTQAFKKYPSDVYHLLASRVQRRDHVPSLSLCGAICMANLGEYCHSFAYDITTHKCTISEDLVFTNDEGLADLQTSLSPNHLLYSNGKVCQRTIFFAVIMNFFEKYFIFPS